MRGRLSTRPMDDVESEGGSAWRGRAGLGVAIGQGGHKTYIRLVGERRPW
jgi:hypothetical protein